MEQREGSVSPYEPPRNVDTAMPKTSCNTLEFYIRLMDNLVHVVNIILCILLASICGFLYCGTAGVVFGLMAGLLFGIVSSGIFILTNPPSSRSRRPAK